VVMVGGGGQLVTSAAAPCLLGFGRTVFDLRRPGERTRLPRPLLGFVSADTALLAPTAKRLSWWSRRAVLALWDFRAGRLVREWPAGLRLVARSPSGRRLALAGAAAAAGAVGPGEGGGAAAGGGGPGGPRGPGAPASAAQRGKTVPTVSDDGRWFAFEAGPGAIRLWDATASAFVTPPATPVVLGAPALGSFGPHGLLATFPDGQAVPVAVHD